jgi:ppGpp synthetase/RelA/SpoT-type nucleotidyltranferase
MNNKHIKEYAERFETLKVIANSLERDLVELLGGFEHIDSISTRVKEPNRFASKAEKKDDNGNFKYTSPLYQIQDQIGARIVVFYNDDVQIVGDEIEKYYRHIEIKELVPESQWAFGYFGKHWVYDLKKDIVPEECDKHAPDFFELQVKTLFQNAWTEANHDLGYKPEGTLTADQERRFAYTAAQAWGADKIFEELRAELSNN